MVEVGKYYIYWEKGKTTEQDESADLGIPQLECDGQGDSALNYTKLALGRMWAQHVVCWGRNQSMVQRNVANILVFGLYALSQSLSYLTLNRCVPTLM